MSGAPAPGGLSVARTVLLLAAGAFASAASLRLCDPMLPALARQFGTTTGQAAVVVTATSVAYGVFQLLFGPLGDRFGKFRVVAWACLVSTLGALGCALSPSLETLGVARAFTGATTAAIIPLSMAWIGDAVAFNQRQPVLAKFMSGQIFGLISGQALGGLFADTLGWRWAFVFLAVLYGWIGIVLLRAVKRLPPPTPETAPPGPASPLGPVALVLADPAARGILVTVFVESMAMFGVIAFIPAFLHERFAISLFHAGLVVAVFGAGGLAYTLFARRWVRFLGQPRLALVGGSLMGGAFLIFALAPDWHWGVVASLLAGLGFYQLHNTLQTQATQMAPAARGTAVSIFASCFFLGQAAGVSIGGIAVDRVDARWLFLAAALILPLVGATFGRRLGRARNPQSVK